MTKCCLNMCVSHLGQWYVWCDVVRPAICLLPGDIPRCHTRCCQQHTAVLTPKFKVQIIALLELHMEKGLVEKGWHFIVQINT